MAYGKNVFVLIKSRFEFFISHLQLTDRNAPIITDLKLQITLRFATTRAPSLVNKQCTPRKQAEEENFRMV
jgi:hypothetical protein